MVLEKFLRCRPMDLQVRRAIHIAVRVFRDRGGVGLGAGALAVPLLWLRLEWWQIELLADVVLADVHVVAGKAVHHEAAVGLGAGHHRERTIVRTMPGTWAKFVAPDDLAAKESRHFLQCWEEGLWHRCLVACELSRDGLIRRAARPRGGGGVRDRTERAFACRSLPCELAAS